MEYNLSLNFWNPSSNSWDERGRVIWSEIRYPDDTWKLLVNYNGNEDRNDVLQSDFKEDSDDVMKKMKTNHILKVFLLDTS